VKYLLLIYSNPETWGHPTFLHTRDALGMPQEQRDEMSGQLEELINEIRETGELVALEALADPVNARTIRVRDSVPVATDGPYVESKEQMAGLFILDCATAQRAEQIAGRLPDARFCTVEMRPMMGSRTATRPRPEQA
jgi:hypothetical protein